ncbi:hypothetical protein E1B28_004025 [Marasmius oreades]|uniref:CP-type G domain-containing protein n=1 Tax=Marasmius oreades TaxID=181124 RepID=A0A9P7UXS1_9AGAR|nr:uncharacterized protein E1B28_004025 [Marasmius oreades]KAG7096608.1 hypothetical protein E1B28_004025 [Marasmius oreades]
MPRIRKKTSKRTKIHERARLHKQIKESKRKKSRDAKKNPQWKSKHKKDPGIPNNFPYKDQVLAEVREQRRLAVEERERKKEEKRAQKAGTVKRADEDSDNEESTSQVEEVEIDDKDGDTEGVGSISAKRIASSRISTRPAPIEVDDEEEEEDEPLLINRDLPNLQSVLDQADCVIQVLDARDPISFRSTQLEELASKDNKRLLFILNKIDVSPREAVKAWSSTLRRDHPTLLFRSATAFLPDNPRIPADIKGKRKASEPSDDAVGVEGVLKCLADWAKQKKNGGPFVAAVVGVANVGKSAFVNSLLKKAALPMYAPSSSSFGPTTTYLPQEVTIDVNGFSIRIIDTPGFSWEFDKTAEDAARLRCHDILIRNRGRIDRLKDPSPPIAEIVARSNTEDLMLLYSLPAFPQGDVDTFLSGVARAQQLVKKRGTLDIAAATRMVLRDWNVGKFRYYCIPPAEGTSPGDKGDQEMYPGDEAVLAALLSRKDMRKAGGLVKMRPGQADSRSLVLVGEYVDGDDDDSNDGSEEEHGEAQIEEGNADDSVSDEGEDEDLDDERDEEEEETRLPVKEKRKRSGQDVSPPKKKVAFSTDRKKPSKHEGRSGHTKPLKSVSRKVASNSSNSKWKPEAADAGSGSEAYDFGRYF